jgi:acid phosphatase type 7
MKEFSRRRGAVLPALAATAAIGLGAVSACSGSGTPAPTASASTSGSSQESSSPAPTGSAASTVSLAAVGDMNNDGNTSLTSATGKVASSILAANPELVFGLGDFQYPKGTCSALVEDYDKVWGKVVPLMFHIAGPNHDWNSTSDEEGYRRHFAGTCPDQTTGPSALVRSEHAPVGPGDFWSRDVGAWHLVGLSTGLWRFDRGKAQQMTRTLDRDLAAAKARGKYLLVAYHDPYFTSTTDRHARYPDVKPWVDVLDRYDVRITLSASQHNYERTCPVLSTGACTPNAGQGTTSFNVSTGGLGLRPFRSSPPYIAKRFADSHGWLALSLHPDGSFAWHYQAVDGTGADAGARPAFPAAAH